MVVSMLVSNETLDKRPACDISSVRWDKSGIAAWFFQRDGIPSDITNNSPDPSTWGTPVAYFASDNCNPYEFFYDHFNIVSDDSMIDEA